MSKHCSLQETAALLQAANKIVLCSHVSPDGDTLGSALSLMKALQKLGKDVIVTVDDEISKVYKFLPGIESFVRFQIPNMPIICILIQLRLLPVKLCMS